MMDEDVYHLTAWHPKHGRHQISLIVTEVNDDYAISCNIPISRQILNSQGSDCFAALQSLRRQAEQQGWKICCKGASENVWPSGMSRDMGGGVQAYVMTMGQQARLDLLVNIFEPDDPENYATVAEQEAFVAAWYDSLG